MVGMEDNKIDWRIYGDIDLSKSCVGEESSKEFWTIQGMILTDNIDLQNEKPILKSMDWSYFDRNGFIKYEHDVNGPNPSTVIGIPHVRKSLPNGEFLTGVLMVRDEQDVKKGLIKDFARETASLIKAVHHHNELFPDKRRTVGFSIEGKYLGKSNNEYWGRPINVVVTPNAMGTETYAEMAKAHNADLIKSLTTGSTYGVTDQTGGAAMRKESIKEDLVSITFDKPEKRKTRGKNMKDEKKVKDFLEEEELENEEIEDVDEKNEKKEKGAEKSLQESASLLKSAANTFKGIVDSFKKSVQPVVEPEPEFVEPEGEIVDITPFMEQVGTATSGLQKSFGEFVDNSEKRDIELAKALTYLADSNEALGNALVEMKTENETMKKSVEDITKLLKAIGKSAPDISFLQLDQEKTVDDNGKAKLSKGETTDILFGLAKDKKINFLEVTKFEQTGKLPPSIAAFPEFAN